MGYYRYQRCGVEVPGVHPACHLDDARRRDTGEHVDAVGGWHDAGDLRKWMDTTMLNAIALLNLLRTIPEPQPGDPTEAQILEEVRHGNLYFLKMQDSDGRVWHDAAGGVNGDNSDNHWTDNQIGTTDDRFVDTRKDEHISAMFATLEASAGQSYRRSDPAYAARCLAAGERAWRGSERGGSTLDVAWWTLAACELFGATGKPDYREGALALGQRLLGSQYTQFVGNQRAVRGFWNQRAVGPTGTHSEATMGVNPYFNIVYPALPALALLKLYETFPAAVDRGRWKDAVALHLDEYVFPMAGRNPHGIIPSGLFMGQPTPETYRPLAGDMTYRYFMPVRKQFWWQGINSHLGCYALLLARFGRIAGDVAGPNAEAGKRANELAFRQLEWIMGANPFGACLMTGEGMRNPYPHSRFVGLIPGGIMNGIAGNAQDEPILDQAYDLDWRTCEYWSPHVAFYLWAVSELERATAAQSAVSSDRRIGRKLTL